MLSGWYELPPWHDTNDREVDADVNQRDSDRTDDDRARYHSSRILDLISDVTDVVVSEVVVNTDTRGGAQAKEESKREVERAGREIERNARAEVRRPGQNHGENGDEGPDPERDGDLRDRLYPPIQQRDVDQANDGDERNHPGSGQPRPQELRILG